MTTTTNHALEKPAQGTQSWHTPLNANFDAIDERLPRSYAGNPNTNVAGVYVGQPILDSANGKLYICTGTGNAASAVWKVYGVEDDLQANNAITNAKLADMAANTLKGNPTGSTADPSDLAILANTFPARSSSGNFGAKAITDFGLSLVDDANAAAALSTLGISSFIQSLLDDSDAATARATLGVSSGLTMCVVKRSSTQSLSNAAYETVLWNDEDTDVGGWHSTSSNTENIVVPATALYLVFSTLIYNSSGNGEFGGKLRVDGSAIRTYGQGNNTANTVAIQMCPPIIEVLSLTANQTVSVQAYAGGGGTQSLRTDSRLAVIRLT